MGRPFKIFTPGEIINGIVLIRFTKNAKRENYALFKCPFCGKEFETKVSSIKSGHTKSCGCKSRELTIAGMTKHGHATAKGASSEYHSWENMLGRVRGYKKTHNKHYKDKGITVCERWLDFSNFLADMGPKPTPKHTIDRWPNKHGNYEPNNCRWATQKQQLSNRSNTIEIVYNNIKKPLTEWYDELKIKIPYDIVAQRIRKGWSFESACYTPIGETKIKTVNTSNFINHTFGHFN